MFESLTKSLQSVFTRWGKDRELTEANIRDGLGEIRRALLDADVHFQVARDLVDEVTRRAVGLETVKGVRPAQQIVKVFAEVLGEAMAGEAPPLPRLSGEPTVVMMVGLQGSGKTTTCAKLARRLHLKEGRRPLLVAADVRRPAAVRQLQVLGERLDLPVYTEEGAEPPDICERAVAEARRSGQDVVIFDTAGRLHIDEPLMRELEEISRRATPHRTYLVCDSMAGQDAYTSAREFHGRVDLSGLILTKLDGDTRGGAAISVRKVTGKPIAWIGTGERLEDLDEFHAERMSSRILGMGDVVSLVEKAQEAMDGDEAEDAAEKLLKAQFTFQDFLSQLKMLRRMGPLGGLLKMLPGGLGDALGQMGDHEKELKQIEALILSMTPHERRQPDLIDASRKRRIARGAGSEISMVNQLLRQFQQMRDMMKAMGSGGSKMLGRMGKLMGGGGMPALAGGGPGTIGAPPQVGRAMVAGGPSAEDRDRARKERKRQRQARKKNRKRR